MAVTVHYSEMQVRFLLNVLEGNIENMQRQIALMASQREILRLALATGSGGATLEPLPANTSVVEGEPAAPAPQDTGRTEPASEPAPAPSPEPQPTPSP